MFLILETSGKFFEGLLAYNVVNNLKRLVNVACAWLRRLEKPVRLMLESFGSSFIRMIGFRDVWAFVGQKGIKGFSPLEEVEPHNRYKNTVIVQLL